MSWIEKLKTGLGQSSAKLGEGIGAIFRRRKLDAQALEELEELLIASDLGVSAAAMLAADLGEQKFDKDVAPDTVKEALAGRIAEILKPVAVKLSIDSAKPYAILMVGVNGNGKTTTIGKLAAQFKREGKTVMLAAADTFRAAAVEQLKIWGERNGVTVVSGPEQADPASVAHRALAAAKYANVDVLLIDTAGRLQNKTNLMDELQKIISVMKKLDPKTPHVVVQVLDATTGQNAIAQVTAFSEQVKVSGLIVTKLDGTAKAGVLVALRQPFQAADSRDRCGRGD